MGIEILPHSQSQAGRKAKRDCKPGEKRIDEVTGSETGLHLASMDLQVPVKGGSKIRVEPH